jgi:hypothetical protein
MPTGMEYAEIQKRNQVGRLRAKLAAKKQAAETAEKGAMVSSESGVATLPPTPTAAIPEESVKAAVAAMERIQLEEVRICRGEPRIFFFLTCYPILYPPGESPPEGSGRSHARHAQGGEECCRGGSIDSGWH